MRTPIVPSVSSFFVPLSVSNSIQAPRFGMIVALNVGAVVGVGVLREVDARRTDELAHDHALRAVDHERALVGHEREIAHEDLLVGDTLDFARLGRDKTDAHAQRRAVGHVALAALLDRILRLAEAVLAELEDEVAGEVLDRRDRIERFPKPSVMNHLKVAFCSSIRSGSFRTSGIFANECRLRFGAGILGQLDGERFFGNEEAGARDVLRLDRGTVPVRRCRRRSVFLRCATSWVFPPSSSSPFCFWGSSCVGSRALGGEREKATTDPPE